LQQTHTNTDRQTICSNKHTQIETGRQYIATHTQIETGRQ
jgi:hypothetical protein